MPISYGSFEKQMKLLPIVLDANGGARVTARIGYVEDGQFVPMSEQGFDMTPDEVSATLDKPPTPGLSRRDDLAFAIYMHLVETGKVQPGHIS